MNFDNILLLLLSVLLLIPRTAASEKKKKKKLRIEKRGLAECRRNQRQSNSTMAFIHACVPVATSVSVGTHQPINHGRQLIIFN